MVNQTCACSQSESGKYFEWIIIAIQEFCSELLFFHNKCPEYRLNKVYAFVYTFFSHGKTSFRIKNDKKKTDVNLINNDLPPQFKMEIIESVSWAWIDHIFIKIKPSRIDITSFHSSSHDLASCKAANKFTNNGS